MLLRMQVRNERDCVCVSVCVCQHAMHSFYTVILGASRLCLCLIALMQCDLPSAARGTGGAGGPAHATHADTARDAETQHKPAFDAELESWFMSQLPGPSARPPALAPQPSTLAALPSRSMPPGDLYGDVGGEGPFIET